MEAYADAVVRGFGSEVDYGRIGKHYEVEPGRYSPPKVASITTQEIVGKPEGICTSHVERQNLTMRMSMRRFTRLTNAFSKKFDNLKAAVSHHFAHYNFLSNPQESPRHTSDGSGDRERAPRTSRSRRGGKLGHYRSEANLDELLSVVVLAFTWPFPSVGLPGRV